MIVADRFDDHISYTINYAYLSGISFKNCSICGRGQGMNLRCHSNANNRLSSLHESLIVILNSYCKSNLLD